MHTKNVHRLTVDTNKVIFALLLEIVLASLLAFCPFTIYLKLLLSLLSIFIIPTVSLTLPFIRSSIDLVKLLFLSLVMSPMLLGSITLFLAVTFPPLNRLLLILTMVLITCTSLLFYVFRTRKVVIFYNEVYLISLSMIFIDFFIVLYIIAGIPHTQPPMKTITLQMHVRYSIMEKRFQPQPPSGRKA